MDHLFETLNNLQPIIIIGMMLLLWIIEQFIPYFSYSRSRKKHTINNLIVFAITFVMNGIASIWINFVIMDVAKNGYGLLNHIALPFAANFIVGMLLIDLWDYGMHILLHKFPLFWRFHRIHHSDTMLDSTSSLRFHPFDVVIQVGYWTPMFYLLGISPLSYIVYFSFYLILIFLQHSNLKLPDWIDRYGSYIFSTPGWHKMHHAAEKKITDSHYGDVFTFWDRIFGTGGKIDVENIQFGIEYYRDEKDQAAKNLLLLPFKPIHPTGQSESENLRDAGEKIPFAH